MTRADRIAEEELAHLEQLGLRRQVETLEARAGATVRIDGRELVNLCSNDYLGLATDPDLVAAAREAARQGTGAGASRLVVGALPIHAELERALAGFVGSEAALLFNTGYCANSGVVAALVGPDDAVFSDALNHASLIDGARLSRAQVEVYPHLDLVALEARLARTHARRKLILTDSVFSMDGDLAPIDRLVELAERHGAMLVVDEAHATGVFGPRGDGLCAHQGVASRVDVRVFTLSKAAGSFGAFAATSKPVCELLLNRARPFIFSTALPPAVCAASLAALPKLEDPTLRARLWQNIAHLARGLGELGLPAEPRSPIFPVVLGSPERALRAAERLREGGVLVKAIRPPTVPAGTSRLRISVSAAHTAAQLDLALGALREALGLQRLTSPRSVA